MPLPISHPVAAPSDEVVLLDDRDQPVGTADRLTVHGSETPLHLAFSLHLLDTDGRTLLTRRALTKRTWPGVWTNSCCGHPRPGEPVADGVRRRVSEELGLAVVAPRLVLPAFRYRAVDASGVVEHELCPVHVAVVEPGTPLFPDPDEVAESEWVPWSALHAAVSSTPVVFSPWAVSQVLALGPDAAQRALETESSPS